MSDDRTTERVPIIGGTEDEYYYAGFGDHCVLLCEAGNPPRWKNAIGLTPDAARSLARQLLWMADASEEPRGEDDDA